MKLSVNSFTKLNVTVVYISMRFALVSHNSQHMFTCLFNICLPD